MRSVAQSDYSIESQPRFWTLPIDEFIDRVTISPLRVLGSEAVQDCGLECSRSSRRKTDLVLLRLLLEVGLCFMRSVASKPSIND